MTDCKQIALDEEKIAKVKAALVLDCSLELGEGPVWDSRENVLYYVDIMGGKMFRFDPYSDHNGIPRSESNGNGVSGSTDSISDTFSLKEVELRQQIGTVVPVKDGKLFAGIR